MSQFMNDNEWIDHENKLLIKQLNMQLCNL